MNLVILGLKHIYTGYLVNANPPTVLPGSFFKTLQLFLSRSEVGHVIGYDIVVVF